MATTKLAIRALDEAARANPDWRWYVIADSAQHRALPVALAAGGGQVRCLLGAALDSPVARKAPHLVALPSPQDGGDAWSWISLNAAAKPCVTIVASAAGFDALFAQLAARTEVVLPDGDAMYFGYWDPAILGTLVGQADDATLHVPGPVLEPAQRAWFLAPVAAWWYWDRDGHFHQVAIAPMSSPSLAPTPQSPSPSLVPPPPTLTLDQPQVDALVEASVPDHVLYFLELNQPLLIEPIARADRYRVVARILVAARAHGLDAMQDLVNFACAALIYQDRFDADPVITALLADVKRGALTFNDALALMP
jgi:hypothetical protein